MTWIEKVTRLEKNWAISIFGFKDLWIRARDQEILWSSIPNHSWMCQFVEWDDRCYLAWWRM